MNPNPNAYNPNNPFAPGMQPHPNAIIRPVVPQPPPPPPEPHIWDDDEDALHDVLYHHLDMDWLEGKIDDYGGNAQSSSGNVASRSM